VIVWVPRNDLRIETLRLVKIIRSGPVILLTDWNLYKPKIVLITQVIICRVIRKVIR
jgi:hypothetical protein